MIMGRPSSATDEIELGWDDLFRFQHVRDLTMGAAWLPSLLIFLLDEEVIQSRNPQSGSFWPEYVAGATFVLVYLLFRQGRQLWRRAWEP
jgi:hypothetical protein